MWTEETVSKDMEYNETIRPCHSLFSLQYGIKAELLKHVFGNSKTKAEPRPLVWAQQDEDNTGPWVNKALMMLIH